MIEILKATDIEKQVYWNQSANISIDQNISEAIEIKKECIKDVYHPPPFKTYFEAIFREALDEK